MKLYNVQYGIGKAKYCVNHYDGSKKHRDGSEAWDIAIYKNKKRLAQYLTALRNDGYREQSALA
jgi:hypothetical protein